MESRLEAIEMRLKNMEKCIASLDREVRVAVNYMREIATTLGIRERLAAIDRDLAEEARRETMPAPPFDGETQS